jgi:hypothetical protein
MLGFYSEVLFFLLSLDVSWLTAEAAQWLPASYSSLASLTGLDWDSELLMWLSRPSLADASSVAWDSSIALLNDVGVLEL